MMMPSIFGNNFVDDVFDDMFPFAGNYTTANYIRRERYSGSCQRSFYVGEGVKQEDLKAAFNNGILTVAVPKEVQKPVEEKQYITIEQ